MNAKQGIVGLIALISLGFPLPLPAEEKDPLGDVALRRKLEAQRVEKEFAEERIAAYRLVRNGTPRPEDATRKIQNLLVVIRGDQSLDESRRQVLLVTLQADLQRIPLIASDNARLRRRQDESLTRSVQNDMRSRPASRPEPDRYSLTEESRGIIESRNRQVSEYRVEKRDVQEQFNKVMESVAESAVAETGNMKYPKDWQELSRKRTAGVKLTAKEQNIMKVLNTVVPVEFEKNSLEEVVAYLRKVTGVEIIVDKRALDEVSVTYDTPINLKMRSSGRALLKKMLAELNLTYVIKDEAIQITNRERANQMTTTRAYYIGDLALAVDVRVPLEMTQLAMADTVNRIITMITQNIDTQSWKVNNSDGVGAIVFDPISMSLVVKQTAEVHFMLSGY